MNEAERRLAEDRALRKSARGLFDSRVAQVRADLAARSVPGRIKAKATDEAARAIEQGVAVAKESKGIIAGTIAALLLWIFRVPLLAQAKRLFAARDQDEVQESSSNDDGISEE